MKKTICLLFMLIVEIPTPSFAATAFWGEDLPLVEATATDQCNLPEFSAKVISSNESKLLEVTQRPTCGSGNVHYQYRLDLITGILSYEFGGPGGTGGEWVSARPINNSDYPVLIRQMEKILETIKKKTNPTKLT